MRSSLRLPQPCDSKVTVTSQTLPSRETFLRKFSVLASKDYSSQSDEKTNTKPGVGGDARASLNEDDRQNATVPQL